MKTWLAVLLLAALPAKLALAEAPPSEVSKADAEKWLAFFDKLVDTIVADQGKCPRMASDVTQLIDANAESPRVEELVEKSTNGQLTPDEIQEYAELVRLNDMLSLLKLQAEAFWTVRAAS